MVVAGAGSPGDPRIPRALDAEKTEQEVDRPEPLRGAKLLQVFASQRTGRGKSGARRYDAEAGQVSARISGSRANRAAVPGGRPQGSGRSVRRCAELRDPRVVLFDRNASLGAARNQSDGHRLDVAAG